MRVLKSIGPIIGLYIVARMLIAMTGTGGAGLVAMANILLACSIVIAVLSMLSGGNSQALGSIKRGAGIIVGLTAFTIAMALMTNKNGQGGFSTEQVFIAEVVPFGNIIGSAMGFFGKGISAQPITLLRIIGDICKLLLQTLLNPILTGFLYVFIFNNKRQSGQSEAAYTQSAFDDFTNPEPAFDTRRRAFSISGAVAGFFGAIITMYATTFLFNWGVQFLAGIIGEVFLIIIMVGVTVGMFLLAWFFPILRSDLRGVSGMAISQSRTVFSRLLFSMVKMVVMNILVVILVGVLFNTAH